VYTPQEALGKSSVAPCGFRNSVCSSRAALEKQKILLKECLGKSMKILNLYAGSDKHLQLILTHKLFFKKFKNYQSLYKKQCCGPGYFCRIRKFHHQIRIRLW
jgi:hypothetical protein